MSASLRGAGLEVLDPVTADLAPVVAGMVPDVVGVGHDEVVELVVGRVLVQVLEVAHCA